MSAITPWHKTLLPQDDLWSHCDENLRVEDTTEICKLAYVHPKILQLSFSRCKFAHGCGAVLATFLSQHHLLSALQLTNIFWANTDLDLIFSGLASNTGLTELDLADCRITEKTPLAEMLLKNTTLRTLNLYIGEVGRSFGEALATNCTIKDVKLRASISTAPFFHGLVKTTQMQSSLQSPQVYPVVLARAEDASAFSEGLRLLPALRSLNLDSLRLPSKDEKVCFSAISALPALTSLEMSGLSSIDVSITSLLHSKTLLELIITSCPSMNFEAVQVIMTAVANGAALERLIFYHCRLPNESAAVIVQALERATNLAVFDLRDIGQVNISGQLICTAMCKNRSVIKLLLGTAAALPRPRDLMELFSQNSTLTSLYFGSTHNWKEEGWHNMEIELDMCNYSLCSLHLDNFLPSHITHSAILRNLKRRNSARSAFIRTLILLFHHETSNQSNLSWKDLSYWLQFPREIRMMILEKLCVLWAAEVAFSARACKQMMMFLSVNWPNVQSKSSSTK